ncbi:PREDICTED: phosphatidate phosphatase LPIN3 [Phaethon lepturus]|uniref:phosphatidate phosphatase LPIN3 n=1 Tax=Phaethon lepturus TaxID=97097 RepID=UPI0005304FE6|nr:PREDICTED: phosphatidate phosphatase LPIN3 [Phaethon lepturus]
MNYVGQLAETVFVTVKELYRGLNPATLTGCIDVVVVRQPDNSFQCSPFHVRFGKLGVLRSREKVVDIEINGEPVDLHMKLGDNGEAFFVQESEENEGSIPSRLCTSPIPRDAAQPSHGQEASGAEATLRKRRRRRRKPKRKEASDSEMEGCEETKSEMSVEEPCKLPAPSDSGHFSFADIPREETGSLQSPEIHPYSDGELAAVDSPTLSHPSSPKSDSELEIRPQESFGLGAESHVQWTWGRLPQVGLEGPEPQPESQRRQGSVKRHPHLGPSDVYLEDLSNLDEEQVALYFPRSDTEQSSKPVADSSTPLCVQLPSDLRADSPMDSDSDVVPAIALSLCGGLAGSRQISREKFMEHMVSYEQFAENPGLIDDPNLVILINKKYYNWAVAAPMVLSLQAFQRNIPESTINRLVKEKMPKKGSRWWFSWRRREFPAEEVIAVVAVTTVSPGRGEEEEVSFSDDEPLHPEDVLAVDAPAQKSQPTYKKSLRLSSEQIERLNLQDGPNEVAFSVTTQYQGTCRCEATIYLWNWDDKVVISDIDGTITKSDALGHILPHLGKDWTHHGIAKLFHKIHLNGYKFLYCSARAIGMAHITKGYLKWVNEQGCALPKGPILLAPSSLFSAFHREVIEKKPEVFKIACLMDIKNLFATKLPFYAAFGNRANDVYAYKQVGLPESRIFTVNPKGELIQELMKNHKSTYERLSEVVELIFPPLGHSGHVALVCPEFSHFAYWRPPLPAVDLDVFS